MFFLLTIRTKYFVKIIVFLKQLLFLNKIKRNKCVFNIFFLYDQSFIYWLLYTVGLDKKNYNHSDTYNVKTVICSDIGMCKCEELFILMIFKKSTT